MNSEDFTAKISRLLGEDATNTAESWVDFAKENVDLNQFAYSKEEPKAAAIENWLNYQYAELYFVKKDFGLDIAQKVWSMGEATDSYCLYPYEMRNAAELFKQNHTKEQVINRCADVGLDGDKAKPHTLLDVQRDGRMNRDPHER